MQVPTLKRGDIFLTSNPMALSKAIRFFTKLRSKDNKCVFSHAGIIIKPNGTTYESLWHVKSQNLFEAYAGENVLIARHECMTNAAFNKAFYYLDKKHRNDFYPFYRLIFHMSPTLAKINTGSVVCSELVAKFLYYLELMAYYNGCTPDDLHDFVCWAYGWTILYNGKLPVRGIIENKVI